MPATPGKIRAGEAYVEAGLNTTKLAAGLRSASSMLQTWGKAMAVAGAAGMAPFALATRAFAGYGEALAELRAAANPTAEQLGRIRAAIDQVSRSTGRDQATTARAFTELLKAGMPLERVLGGAAEAAVKFARVGGIDVPAAATAMNDALNVFAREGLTATQAVDTLSKAADASSISIGQITEAFAMSASIYGDAGLSMNDLSSAIALMGNAGVKGSDAGSHRSRSQGLRGPA